MKKLLTFFVLLLHMNINTEAELIFHSFSLKTSEPIDEDNDQPQFL
ncbi:MAG: hypothetical protein ACR2KB_09255 [Chitinophagaceae bacterium]